MKPNRLGFALVAVALIVAALALTGCTAAQPTPDISATVAKAIDETAAAKPTDTPVPPKSQ